MLLKATNYFWGIVLLVIIVLSIVWGYISTDAPYYLSVARDISRGSIPYKDIYLSYTPVMMYLNSLIYFVFSEMSYFISLGFQYFIIAISSLMIFKFSYKEFSDIKTAIFLALIFFISVLASDGTYINLEVYVILFVFLAYWFYLKKRFFLCGFLLALSFFSKQYGLFNFLPFFLLILVITGYKKSYLFRFILGGLIPLFIFIIYFVFIAEVPYKDLILQLTGAGYDQEMLELETTWFSFLAGAKIFILLLIPLFLLGRKLIKDKINAVLILGILVNLIPLYIQTVSHYFVLSFPYIFLLLTRNLDDSNKKFNLGTNLVLLIIAGLLFARLYRYREVYKEQQKLAVEIEKEYPVGSEVFLYKHYRFLYILNDYKNPVLQEVGYRYGYYPDKEFREEYEVLAR